MGPKFSPVDLNDNELTADLRAGKDAAYELAFRAYHARLCGFAYGYLQNRADAEEVVQDLFLALWEKREHLDVRTSLKSYLFTAVRNRVLNRSARARLEQNYYDQIERAGMESETETPAADDELASAQIATRVQAALAELPPGCRRVLVLRWQEDLSYAEIAEALGISVKGVENQLARARKALRQRLGFLIDQ
jgi:RNA polymerase sigma-70 factor, ECF subfamily